MPDMFGGSPTTGLMSLSGLVCPEEKRHNGSRLTIVSALA